MLSDLARRRLTALERCAQDDSIPFFILKNALVRFTIDFGYYRTPYQLYIPLILRARARRFESDEEACSYFNHQKELTYPDINNKKVKLRWGRCNSPSEAVFYGASENVITMFEVRPEKDDYLILGHYCHPSYKDIELMLPVIGVEQIVNSLRERRNANPLANILLKDMHYTQAVDPEILAIDRHFANWFIQAVDASSEHYYKLSTAFYQTFTKNVVIEGNQSFDGLVYPSVASDITGVNIALKPDFVDSHLKLWQAVLYKVENVDLENKQYTLQPRKDLSAIHPDGKLEWKDSDMKEHRLIFNPNTPTFHANPSEDYFKAMSLYK